jgi:hypothetical protein
MAPDIQAQWLKRPGITVWHFLWSLLALTHVAFAIDPTEHLTELNRTCRSKRDRAPDGSGTFAQSAGADLWLGGSSGLCRFDGEHFEPSDGGYSPGQAWSPAQGPKRAAGTIRPPAERSYHAVTPANSSGWQRVLARFLPIRCALLWITFFNRCSINNLCERKIGLIHSAFAVH